jgi:hypothetical protein
VADEHPAVIAAGDQASAAAADVTQRMRVATQFCAEVQALTTGKSPVVTDEEAHVAAGPRAKVLGGLFRRMAAGEVSGCLHADAATRPGRPGPAARELIWVSWQPDMISCTPCALLLPGPSIEESNRCDGCGCTGSEWLESITYILPASATYAARAGHLVPPLVCCFDLCGPCDQASRSQEEAPSPGPG